MPSVIKQQTIRREVACYGIGLHSGEMIHLKLLPAPEGSGIVFLRTDLGGIMIPADASHVISTHLSTTLGVERAVVQTVEHLLSAVSAFGVDNLFIELDGAEVPILDGSAAPFAALLSEAGIVEQRQAKKVIQLVEPVSISEKGKTIAVYPSSSFEISYEIQFDHPLISNQAYLYRHDQEAFVNLIAPARTFGFLKDVQMLQSQGLARGGSLENAIVIGEDQILNEQGLRFPDEFVRHKILDLIGDFSLLGMPILGRIKASCSGHLLHAKLMREILKNKKTWKVIDAISPVESYTGSAYQPAYSPLSPAI
ncbi:MAG: UDP-3-O-acyl-N-acetylglucosamine deacetylase [Nitrospirae bacterium]|nr:UDP-3-O-acyl-N-acetylglucosamine deacetylase [Candidatus Manganitrophaceae bacterium]